MIDSVVGTFKTLSSYGMLSPRGMLQCRLLLTLFVMVHVIHQGEGQRYCHLCSWSSWATVGECSSSCGGGKIQAWRSLCCDRNISPDHCRQRCHASHLDVTENASFPCNVICFHLGDYNTGTRSCVCRHGYHGRCCEVVDGQWGVWGNWGRCSVPCGTGERVRTRLCNSPAPINGGRPCTVSQERGNIHRQVCVMSSCSETTQSPGLTRAVAMTTLTDVIDSTVVTHSTDVTDSTDMEGSIAGEREEDTIAPARREEDTTAPASDNTNIFLGIGLAGTILVLIVAVITVVTVKRRKDAKPASAEDTGETPSMLRMQMKAEPLYENSEIREATLDSTEGSLDDVETPVEYANSEFSISVEDHAEYNHLDRSREPSPGSDLTYGHLNLEEGDYNHIQRDSAPAPIVSDNLYGHLVTDDSEYDHLELNRTQKEVVNGNIYNG